MVHYSVLDEEIPTQVIRPSHFLHENISTMIDSEQIGHHSTEGIVEIYASQGAWTAGTAESKASLFACMTAHALSYHYVPTSLLVEMFEFYGNADKNRHGTEDRLPGTHTQRNFVESNCKMWCVRSEYHAIVEEHTLGWSS